MKRILVTVLIMILLVPAAFAADIPADYYSGEMYVVGCRESVSLRAEPDTSSEALLQIPRNTMVECEPYDQKFARVRYDGKWGYVLTDYLDADKEGDSGMYMWVAHCREWVSLREEPSTESSRLAQVPLGTRVYVEGDENGFCWCYLADSGLSGYILAEYLSPN